MKFLKSSYKNNTALSALLIALSVGLLPACEQARVELSTIVAENADTTTDLQPSDVIIAPERPNPSIAEEIEIIFDRRSDRTEPDTPPRTRRTPAPNTGRLEIPTGNDISVTVHTAMNTNTFKAKHFNLLVVIDPNTLKQKPQQVYSTSNNSAEFYANRKQKVSDMVEEFVTGFNNSRQNFDLNNGLTTSETTFTLGLVAASNSPEFSGVFFDNTLIELNSNNTNIASTLYPKLVKMAREDVSGDGNQQIPGGHPYISIQQFIENNPLSTNQATAFLDGKTPVVVLTIGHLDDFCNSKFDDKSVSSHCQPKHNFDSILKTLIKTKVETPIAEGIFAPVSFKHIFLDKETNSITTFNDTDKTLRRNYDAQTHGERFAESTIISKRLFKVKDEFNLENLVIKLDDTIDDNCSVNVENNEFFITKPNQTISIYLEGTEATQCESMNGFDFKKHIIDTLYQEEMYSLE